MLREKALICGLFSVRQKETEISACMIELRALCRTAGADVVAETWQKRNAPDRKYLIGLGKAEEIRLQIAASAADLVVFFNGLSALQQRNMEDLLGVKVIDRSRLILDIFAKRARSIEGKLQVELAQLLYMLPRLTGKGVGLSRLGGGIGTRGPGESKLETDRRLIKDKISHIRRKLETVLKNRDVQRQRRRSLPVPLVSLVGYTSAGKSTLFKTLSGEEVFISDKLFSTLDPLLRRVDLFDIHPGYYFILSDTVGFIRSMPDELYTSFQASLEEVHHADLVLHVIDVTNSDWLGQKIEVERVLKQLKIAQEKIITVYNKIDLLADREALLKKKGRREVYVSAVEPLGIAVLKEEIFQNYFTDYELFQLEVASEQKLDALSQWAIILEKNRIDGVFRVGVLSSREKMLKFREKHGGPIQ
ncbi:MAG: GTPase HflX [Candidatus Aminicenantes bacterium]|nr:GTPase HflX [Candidatus Aminicenantes bacterium]